MKPLKTLQNFNLFSRMKPWHKKVAANALTSLGVVTVLAAVIWFFSPLLVIHGQAAFAPPQKRGYIIMAFYLLWLLKFLILDFDVPRDDVPQDEPTQKALDHLLQRFQGALTFMQNTQIAKNGHPTPLNALPWYLIIGPQNAGKTALLTHANVNYILQRQRHSQSGDALNSSEHCDWWVTRDACLIDVPGKYTDAPTRLHAKLWSSFLQLIKSTHYDEQCCGVLLTLPLPELLNASPEKINALIGNLKKRLENLQMQFQRTLPCMLVITKCDLLPGFNEYFGESTDDELTQAWGITLPNLRQPDKLEAVFSMRFNALIKKLNQQLIWRLHQERNPFTRPPIKDFPLQVERLKQLTLTILRKLKKSTSAFQLQAVYLTSALQQHETETTTETIDAANESKQLTNVFKTPTPASRAYFIKQLLSYGLCTPLESTPVRAPLTGRKKRKLAYAASALLVIAATLQLGRDFEHGVKQTQNIKQHLATYELHLKSFQNPNDTLIKTIDLLNGLQASVKPETLALNVKSIFKFYTHRSDQKAVLVYREALQRILLPEIGNYLADSLKTPTNYTQNQVYQLLAAYLMLGDREHFNSAAIQNTFIHLVENTIPAETLQPLRFHLSVALAKEWRPIALNTQLIQATQGYLNALPVANLAYLIIKNQPDMTNMDPIDLNLREDKSALFTKSDEHAPVPALFTANQFTHVITRDSKTAAHEVAYGNWILGVKTPDQALDETALLQQLQETYINDYVRTWENQLNGLRLAPPKDLAQLDATLMLLIADNSPLTRLVKTVHDNTYFQAIASISPKLYSLGQTLDKRSETTTQLPQIVLGLQNLHNYIQPVITADSPRKAAYQLIAKRMMHQGEPDAITSLRLIADKSPEPLKSWLNDLSNDTWQFLSQTAMHYIDTSWKEEVIQPYADHIAHHYPFEASAKEEVAIRQFTHFFGNPGVITRFYTQYLAPFVDTSAAEWRWKKLNNEKLPFTDDSLRSIQQAVRIHHAFFPNGDNQLVVKFDLQPYQFGKDIKSVALNINNNQITDVASKKHTAHELIWPGRYDYRMSSLDVTLKNDEMVHADFPGTWGWLKLLSQSYESPVSQKEILMNFTQKDSPVKYTLSTNGQFNPLITLNLYHFRLPEQLLNA